jgi:hypothetical protein
MLDVLAVDYFEEMLNKCRELLRTTSEIIIMSIKLHDDPSGWAEDACCLHKKIPGNIFFTATSSGLDIAFVCSRTASSSLEFISMKASVATASTARERYATHNRLP